MTSTLSSQIFYYYLGAKLSARKKEHPIAAMNRERARIWRFDLILCVPALSGPEDVCDVFRSILDKARERDLRGLDQSSFSYDVPGEGGLAQVSGYLHVTSHIYRTAVQTWILDDRIQGEIEWTAIHPKINGNWKKHERIADIFAACNGGSRRLADWIGESSAPISRGGRPRTTPAPADDGAGGAAAPSVPRPRGRPRRPQPVDTDSPLQAAVRARLLQMRVATLGDLCAVLLPGDGSWRGQSALFRVETLMARDDELELARRLQITPADPPPVPTADTPEQAAMRASLNRLDHPALCAVATSVFGPADFSWQGRRKCDLVSTLMSRPAEMARALAAIGLDVARLAAAGTTVPDPPPPTPPPSSDAGALTPLSAEVPTPPPPQAHHPPAAAAAAGPGAAAAAAAATNAAAAAGSTVPYLPPPPSSAAGALIAELPTPLPPQAPHPPAAAAAQGPGAASAAAAAATNADSQVSLSASSPLVR